MQGAQQQPQYGALQLGNAELWDALQRQQAAAMPHMNGGAAPQMVPSSGYGLQPTLGAGMVPQPQGMGTQQAPMVLSGKPLAFGAGQYGGTGGITGVPSCLTSLPGMPYSTTPPPTAGTAAQQQPQLYSSMPGSTAGVALAGIPLGAVGPGAAPGGGYPQLSGLSSQLSSGMVLTGAGAGGMVPNPQALQLSGALRRTVLWP